MDTHRGFEIHAFQKSPICISNKSNLNELIVIEVLDSSFSSYFVIKSQL